MNILGFNINSIANYFKDHPDELAELCFSCIQYNSLFTTKVFLFNNIQELEIVINEYSNKKYNKNIKIKAIERHLFQCITFLEIESRDIYQNNIITIDFKNKSQK